MTGCWSGKVAGHSLNILIFISFIIGFNIIFVMRTGFVSTKRYCRLRGCGCFPGLLCCDPKMLPVLHRTHCT
ncbi:hypothetical protein CT151_25050 [Raoultella planticola]|nr:hypothetical protein CT151_25050 [Raoultella planticola]